ncbi:MAG: sulfotransferase family 2 domain-containing protein [Bauldia sp.]
MLCHAYRTILVHVPKTAGQSIEMVFLGKLNLVWEERAPLLLQPNRDPTRGPPRLAHLYASEYVGLGHVRPETFASYFKFGVVRNPWARAVSEYKFAYRPRGVPFRAFLGEVIGRRRGVVEARHIDPQVQFLCAADGTRMVDRVLRYESLASEFAEVSQAIFGEAHSLPMRNVSRDRTDYRVFYDDDSRQFIAKAYRDDVRTFGYEFDDG